MHLFSILLLAILAPAFGADQTVTFPQQRAQLELHWTQGPYVVKESFIKLKLTDLDTHQEMAAEDISMDLIPVGMDIKAPKAEVHFDYQREGQFQVSRIFFTAAGKWKLLITLNPKSKKDREEASVLIDVQNQNNFPKDTVTFPYVGVKAHKKVGMLGGTGCRRRWDFVDTHDSTSVNMPYDLCGKYSMVSARYQKWIDLSVYGDHSEKINIMPLKGDAVLLKASCSNRKNLATYKLVHHPECGDAGRTLTYCDKAGNPVRCHEI